jgi:hypothetical protein
MRAFGLAVIATTIAAATAVAAEGRFERSLKMLAPAERLEQLCDYTAMSRIREQSKDYRPRPRRGECDGGAGCERRSRLK